MISTAAALESLMATSTLSRKIRSLFGTSGSSRRRIKDWQPAAEVLENRQMLTVTVRIQQNALTITGDNDNNHVDVFDDPATGGVIVETYQNWMDPNYPNSPKEVFKYQPGLFDRITFIGNPGDDRLFVHTGVLSLPVLASGGAGDDFLYGGEANDALYGGPGRDLLVGGAGNDRLYGDDGDDTLIGDLGLADTQKTGTDRLYGGEGNDILWGDGGTNIHAVGIGSNDILFGQGGDDYLDGQVGDDTVDGGSGIDRILVQGLDQLIPFDETDVIEFDQDNGPIPTYYKRLANAQQLLGTPANGGAELVAADGVTRYRTYQKGIILSHPVNGTYEIAGNIYTKWQSLGGFGNSIVGNPVTATRQLGSVQLPQGQYQKFQTGSIFDRPAKGTFELHGEIHKKWWTQTLDTVPLGLPVSDEHDFRAIAGGTLSRRNLFDQGMIVWTPQRGAISVHGDIHREWASKTTDLGLPIGGRTKQGTTEIQFFELGRIYQHQGQSAFSLSGEFLVNLIVYSNQGINFGLPLGPVKLTLNVFTSVLRCEFGAIYKSNNGFREVHGEIYKRYVALGSEASSGPLGLLFTNEQVAADGIGRISTFKNGAIFWTPQTGAQAVYGEIYKTYKSLGFEKSSLGYPIASEAGAGAAYRVSKFQKGAIFWSVPTGSLTIDGRLYNEYVKRGSENGFLQRPVAPMVRLTLGSHMEFEGGKLSVAASGYVNQTFAQMKSALLSFTRVNTLTSAALSEMRAMVADGKMSEHVKYLAQRVVNTHRENNFYQGAVNPDGNLAAGNNTGEITVLVNKWFGGLDHPIAVWQPPEGTKNPTEQRFTYANADGVLFGSNGPSRVDIDQGALGSCYFLAAMGALLDVNTNYIRNMFIDNGDGTYTVRFFLDGVAAYVTVDRQLPVNGDGRLVFSGGGRKAALHPSVVPLYANWTHLAEKAYAQINETGRIAQSGKNAYNEFLKKSGGIEGGNSGLVFQHIANRPYEVFAIPRSRNVSDIVRRIDHLFGTKYSVGPLDTLKKWTTGFAKGITMGTVNRPKSEMGGGLIPNHEYMVIGGNTVSVVVVNPWGGSDSIKILPWSVVEVNFAYWTRVL